MTPTLSIEYQPDDRYGLKQYVVYEDSKIRMATRTGNFMAAVAFGLREYSKSTGERMAA